MAKDRTPRELESRDETERPVIWIPSGSLPSPNPRDGWSHRWIRTGLLSEVDNRNVSKRFREGWVPIVQSEYPELKHEISDHNSKWAGEGHLEIGGQLLCKAPSELVRSRHEQIAQQNDRTIESLDARAAAMSDPRMPMLKPERKTKVSFGSGGV